RRDAARDMSGLVTVQASRASMTQRAGRAARLGPGTAVRLIEESAWSRAPEQVTPQISTADLMEAALTLAAWGSPRGAGMPLLTPPPDAAIAAAEDGLRGLGLVDGDGRITEEGLDRERPSGSSRSPRGRGHRSRSPRRSPPPTSWRPP